MRRLLATVLFFLTITSSAFAGEWKLSTEYGDTEPPEPYQQHTKALGSEVDPYFKKPEYWCNVSWMTWGIYLSFRAQDDAEKYPLSGYFWKDITWDGKTLKERAKLWKTFQRYCGDIPQPPKGWEKKRDAWHKADKLREAKAVK